jgi:hypothetical protein
MQSFVWKPGISVSTASLGNSGVIDTLNPWVFFHESVDLTGGLERMAAGGRQTCHCTVQ